MISVSQFVVGFVLIILAAMAIIELTDDKPISPWLVKKLGIPEGKEEE
ncbi:hypothetical protein [Lacticaseibacillus sp. N501-2]